jgi:hypothetical protein
METRMKIKLTPVYVTVLNLDTASEGAIMKQHLPRARKIASASNLLTLLAQHYGTARTFTGTTSHCSDRWLDCDSTRAEPQQNPCVPNSGVALTSPIGILTQEITINAEAVYPICYQIIKLFIPLDPEKSVECIHGTHGAYPARIDPCIVYSVEID